MDRPEAKLRRMRFTGTKEIKEHVVRVLRAKHAFLAGTRSVDFPAGNGVTSAALKKIGSDVVAVDLFPELFRVDNVRVERGDLSATFPFADSEFDFAICQEGIEHVGNQDHVFREFSRVLKIGGSLLLTTPNYSNLKSKMSYLLCESEAFGRIMPPNEHDTIWLSPGEKPGEQSRIYFGHCFLTGFFRLRLFAKLAGFKLTEIHASKVNSTSLMLFPLLYPFVCLSAWKTARRFRRKTGQIEMGNELFSWMVNPQLLLENHLILEFEKQPPAEVARLSRTTKPTAETSELGSFTT